MKMSEANDSNESLALLKILALGRKDLEEGKTKPFRSAFADIRTRIKKEQSPFPTSRSPLLPPPSGGRIVCPPPAGEG